MNRLNRMLAAVAAVGVVAAGLTVGPAADQAQAAAGDITISGHGYGHGRGLSQWGSYGYATSHGWNHLQILGHYYGGTTVGNVGDPQVSVRLTGRDGSAPEITSGAAFSVGGWFVGPGSSAQVSRASDGGWTLTTRWSCGGALGSTVRISDPTFVPGKAPSSVGDMLSFCSGERRAYRGKLRMVHDGGLRTVNVIGMQDYLRGVVPRESPASWGDAANGKGLNALMAQAVAARSYAHSERKASWAQTCDTTACQVYGGAGLNGASVEDRRTNDAIDRTWGQVLTRKGAVVRAEFSASSGGWTAGGDFPAVRDDGDVASPYYDWSVTVPAAKAASAFGVGNVSAVTVLKRNGLGRDGGRVTSVRVTGSKGSVDVTGDRVRTALGLRSAWFSTSLGAAAVAPVLRDLSPVGVAAVRTGAGSVVTVVRGSDEHLYWAVGRGGRFGGYSAIPGATRSAPAAVAWDGARIDLFAVGPQQQLLHAWTAVGADGVPTRWSAWEDLGGVLTSAPAAASSSANTLGVVARGGDGAFYQRSWDGNRWTPWIGLGGYALTGPSLDVVDWTTLRVSTVGSDGAVWSRRLNSNGTASSAGWTWTGRTSSIAPSASGTSWWSRNVRALVRGDADGALVQDVESSGAVRKLGGRVTSATAVVELADGAVWTFARGGDDALWLNVVPAGGSSSTWTSLGGRLS